MRMKGIQTSIHYPPVHLFSFYRDRFGHKEGTLPITEDVTKREVTLPLYPLMDSGSIEYITLTIKSLLP